MKTLRSIMFKLLPKDIKQELIEGVKSDLEHLKQLGLVEDKGIGVTISSKGAAYLVQERHIENSRG